MKLSAQFTFLIISIHIFPMLISSITLDSHVPATMSKNLLNDIQVDLPDENNTAENLEFVLERKYNKIYEESLKHDKQRLRKLHDEDKTTDSKSETKTEDSKDDDDEKDKKSVFDDSNEESEDKDTEQNSEDKSEEAKNYRKPDKVSRNGDKLATAVIIDSHGHQLLKESFHQIDQQSNKVHQNITKLAEEAKLIEPQNMTPQRKRIRYPQETQSHLQGSNIQSNFDSIEHKKAENSRQYIHPNLKVKYLNSTRNNITEKPFQSAQTQKELNAVNGIQYNDTIKPLQSQYSQQTGTSLENNLNKTTVHQDKGQKESILIDQKPPTEKDNNNSQYLNKSQEKNNDEVPKNIELSSMESNQTESNDNSTLESHVNISPDVVLESNQTKKEEDNNDENDENKKDDEDKKDNEADKDKKDDEVDKDKKGEEYNKDKESDENDKDEKDDDENNNKNNDKDDKDEKDNEDNKDKENDEDDKDKKDDKKKKDSGIVTEKHDDKKENEKENDESKSDEEKKKEKKKKDSMVTEKQSASDITVNTKNNVYKIKKNADSDNNTQILIVLKRLFISCLVALLVFFN